MNTPTWLDRLRQNTQANSPWILSGLAVAGVIGTAVLAVRGTPKALENIEQLKEDAALEQNCDHGYAKITNIEIVKVIWRPYLPSMLSGSATIACIIASTQIGMRRNAALVGAYTLVERAYREYKDEVVSQIGEGKEEKVRTALAERQVRNLPASNEVVILGKGDVLCLDGLSGRQFKSGHETIRRAVNDCDAEILTQGYCDLNKFYELVGLPSVDIGDILGWNLDHRPELQLTTALNECNVPVLVVGFKYDPVHDYGKIF
jgi:hypothetical protein